MNRCTFCVYIFNFLLVLQIQQFIRTRSMECTIPRLEVSLFNRELNDDFKVGLQEKVSFE